MSQRHGKECGGARLAALTINVGDRVQEEAQNDDGQHDTSLDEQLLVADRVVSQELLQVHLHLITERSLKIPERVPAETRPFLSFPYVYPEPVLVK